MWLEWCLVKLAKFGQIYVIMFRKWLVMLGFMWDTFANVPAESCVIPSTPQHVTLHHLFKLCDTDMSGFTVLVHKNLLHPCLTRYIIAAERGTKDCDKTLLV